MAKFEAVRQGDFPALRRLLWCGEVLPTPTLRYWMPRLPHVTFTNLYGPTETAIASTYYTVPHCPGDDREPIPIGRPCGGEDVLLLDDALAPTPAGEIGEICIRGVGLSPGYWRDPERTAQVFVELPGSDAPGGRVYRTGDLGRMDENGLLYFLGRKDSQIKSRGYRIELGEIEAALESLGLLRECAVVALPGEGFEGTAIGCGYVPSGAEPITPLTLRQALARLLPTYMLPARWLEFDQLPRNANGKIDRREIRERISGSVPAS
jgi:acyl-coenzyme A synthetase/AMP-(fatty) acid ligase